MTDLKRILYVEDEPDIQTVTRIVLESIGKFTVRVCSSGAEALECAMEFKPDLYLLDVMMPGMDGPQTLTRLQQLPELNKIPVIFMTAKVQPHEIQQLQDLGAIEIIAKPFDPMTLTDQINSAWLNYSGG